MDREYGTPLTPPARAYLRSLGGGRHIRAKRSGRLLAFFGIGGASALAIGILVFSLAAPPPSVDAGATTYHPSGLGRVAFDVPDGWAPYASDDNFYGPLILYAPLRGDVNLPPAAIRFDATIAEDSRLTACGVPVTQADGTVIAPATTKSAEETLKCLVTGLLASGLSGQPLPSPDGPAQIFTYGAAQADTGLGSTALELRWTNGQIPWSPASPAPPTPAPSLVAGIPIPVGQVLAPTGPEADYPQIGGMASNPDTGNVYGMAHLMAIYLPRKGAFDGPQGTRRFLVVTMSYSADLSSSAISGLQDIFKRLTRSLAFV